MKTEEELNALNEKVEILSKKLHELNEEELTRVSGGSIEDSLKKLHNGMKIDSGSNDNGGYQIDDRI